MNIRLIKRKTRGDRTQDRKRLYNAIYCHLADLDQHPDPFQSTLPPTNADGSLKQPLF